MNKLCTKCGKHIRMNGQRWCKKCHNAYMRKWRKTHPLTREQKEKDIARSYAYVYLKRGKLKKQACVVCGSNDSQMHHPDYSDPLNVVWLCKKHHLELHQTK